jgi:hypothetical protein
MLDCDWSSDVCSSDLTPLAAAWAAVLAAPDDDAALGVLGDALLDAGDPHGELIQLQRSARPARELVDRHVATHAVALLGDEARLISWAPTFALGFLFAAGPLADAAELDALLGLPVGRLVRRLRLEQLTPAMLERLEARAPVALEELWLSGSATIRGGDRPQALTLGPLLARLPRLATLLVQAERPDFTGAQSASLRSLFVDLQAGAEGLETARFEQLGELTLTLPFRQLELPPPILSGALAPALRQLAIGGALWPSQLQALAASQVLRGLEALTLTVEPGTGWYPVLIQAAEHFAHLRQLNLRPDRHHPEWVAALKELLPRVSYVGMS